MADKYKDAQMVALLPDTHEDLHGKKEYQESYNDTVARLIEFHNEHSGDT